MRFDVSTNCPVIEPQWLRGYCHIKCGLATLDGWIPENPYISAIGFLRTSFATQYDCTIVSASVIGMSKIYWPNVESSSPRFGGVRGGGNNELLVAITGRDHAIGSVIV